MRKLSADLIAIGDGTLLSDHYIVLEGQQVVAISPMPHSSDGVEYHRGILCPGFINAHCHLELSHMKQIAPTGTGLIPFIKTVVTQRDFPQEAIQEAIRAADQEMYEQGIVAVGDICNQVDTAAVKRQSPIAYYSFVELFDFLNAERADSVFDNGKAVWSAQPDEAYHKKSLVPHAPYSVSPALFSKINSFNKGQGSVSIHNQELSAENDLFLHKKGEFVDFYRDFNISLDDFEPTGQRSIYYAMEHMDTAQRTLFVHNTMTTLEDIKNATRWNPNCYWVSCPNANLYIENKLPHYQDFIDAGVAICLGTDSLTSNWQLSILEEMKTIKKYQSYLEDSALISWATYNGARALGMEDRLGTIAVGKEPGINLIDVEVNADKKFDISSAKKVVKLDHINTGK